MAKYKNVIQQKCFPDTMQTGTFMVYGVGVYIFDKSPVIFNIDNFINNSFKSPII